MAAWTERSDQAADVLAPLVDAPGESAIFSDVDGTLAPIVQRPSQARVPDEARELLAELADRYALVGCISGRRAAEVREMVGLDRLHYVGIHGFERLEPGDTEPRPDSRLNDHVSEAREYIERVGGERIAGAGLRVEDKGAIQALHWRGAADEKAAEWCAEEIGAEAADAGLVPHLGRKVLEIRPPVPITKGTALAELVSEAAIAHCLYAGDDHTDLHAYDALDRLTQLGRLRSAVRVGVAAEESPPEIGARADIVVPSPPQLLDLLSLLLS